MMSASREGDASLVALAVRSMSAWKVYECYMMSPWSLLKIEGTGATRNWHFDKRSGRIRS